MPSIMQTNTAEEKDWLNHILADKAWKQLKSHLHH